MSICEIINPLTGKIYSSIIPASGGGTPNLQEVCDIASVTTTSITTSNLIANQITDISGNTGNVGQILSVNLSGIIWSNGGISMVPSLSEVCAVNNNTSSINLTTLNTDNIGDAFGSIGVSGQILSCDGFSGNIKWIDAGTTSVQSLQTVCDVGNVTTTNITCSSIIPSTITDSTTSIGLSGNILSVTNASGILKWITPEQSAWNPTAGSALDMNTFSITNLNPLDPDYGTYTVQAQTKVLPQYLSVPYSFNLLLNGFSVPSYAPPTQTFYPVTYSLLNFSLFSQVNQTLKLSLTFAMQSVEQVTNELYMYCTYSVNGTDYEFQTINSTNFANIPNLDKKGTMFSIIDFTSVNPILNVGQSPLLKVYFASKQGYTFTANDSIIATLEMCYTPQNFSPTQ